MLCCLPAGFGFANAASSTRSIHLWLMKTKHFARYFQTASEKN